jgi:DNA-binding LacI/PurR family transcriptional regulator
MGSRIEPIEKTSRCSQLAMVMEKRIHRGDWPAGTRIPATRDLAEQFGTSRKTVQDAIGLLEKRKLVSRRPRVGCVVHSTAGRVQRHTIRKKAQIGIITIGGYTPYIPPPPADYSRDWFWSIIGGMQPDMVGHGKLMTMIPTHLFDKEPLAALLERVDGIRETLAGILCYPLSWPAKQMSQLTHALDERQIPYVTLNRVSNLTHHNFVSADFIGGTRLVGRCLARMGVRRVLMLGTKSITSSHSEMDRVGGLFQGYALEDAPTQEIHVIRCADHRMESGHGIVSQYLNDHPTPQAVVAMGDFLAQGAIKALTERGLRIPDDVGVIGGTGLPQAREMTPSLTRSRCRGPSWVTRRCRCCWRWSGRM